MERGDAEMMPTPLRTSPLSSVLFSELWLYNSIC